MNYIGSKFSLLPEIERVLGEGGVPADGIALDLFAGTGIVAQLLKKRGHITYANDWQCYSQLTCIAHIEHNELPEFRGLLSHPHWGPRVAGCHPISLPPCANGNGWTAPVDSPSMLVLSYLSTLPGKPGPFYHAYCEGGEAGRQYFSAANGLRIQAIRDLVEEWGREELVTPKEKAWLVASLLEGADRVANTASVYGAYLKHIKQSAQRPLRLCVPVPVPSKHPADLHRVFRADGETLLGKLNGERLRLVYIDPPYNARQYNANYHILETLARWDLDRFEPRGVTGLRESRENRSDYCRKPRVLDSFHRLLGAMNSDYVLFSYNNEGLVPRDDLEALFAEHCGEVRFEEIAYKRFRADNDGENRAYKGDSTVEFLILGKLRR